MTEYGRIHTDGSRSGGQPLIANRKAHTMIIEVLAAWGIEPSNTTPEQLTIATTEALCRAIKQIEDLRAQAQAQYDRGYYDGCANPIVRHDALRDALQHCADAIASWAKKPEGADPWLLGALDNALEALE